MRSGAAVHVTGSACLVDMKRAGPLNFLESNALAEKAGTSISPTVSGDKVLTKFAKGAGMFEGRNGARISISRLWKST